MKIYIACGLTHVPRQDFPSYSSTIHKIADCLIYMSNEVKYALKNSDPQLAELPEEKKALACYAWDKNMVEEADIIIAEASYPSIGLGIELQIAENKKIPIILIHKISSINKAEPIKYINPDKREHMLQIGKGYISLMALGIPSVILVIPYKNDDDLLEEISARISNKLH